MAIKLYFGNKLETLTDKFLEAIELEYQTKENVFESPLAIIPNPNLLKWLQLTIATKKSIFMNIDFKYLESGLWNLLSQLDLNADDKKPKMLTGKVLQMLIVYELQNISDTDPDFSLINDYLIGNTGRKGPDYAARLWQFSEKLAFLFWEYELNRVDMIKKWLANKNNKLQGMELCQQRLYLRVKKLQNTYFQNTDAKFLSMIEYNELLPNPSTKNKIKKCAHFFGLSQISSLHLQLIDQLKDFYDIFIYALNPCEEFWEDIKIDNETALSETYDKQKNALLSLWGRPGRECISLLCQLTEYNFETCFVKEKNISSVLQKIQNNILTLSSEETNLRFKQDRSLQIIASPCIYREVETVYNSILFNLEHDKNLRLTDVAILVPNISVYKPVFGSVFNRTPKCLSYNLVDSHADIESLYGQAVLAIMELAGSRFSRKQVFNLILNPYFMSKWEIRHDEAQIWAFWAESLNIFHSFDQNSKLALGYPANALYTWKQGLQRLRLSRIMSIPDEECNLDKKNPHGFMPFCDLNTDDATLMEKFCTVIEKLHCVMFDLNKMPLSGKTWKQKLLETWNELLEIPENLTGETSVQHALIESLDNLEIYDQIAENETKAKIDIDLIKEFIKFNLKSISGGHGNYLTSGVTISALQPMRPIPFKIIYALGMEEGKFPGKADTSSLDLMLLKRKIGDVSSPERNCYLFLETLLSAHDKFYISYVSKDLQKDRILQPCSLAIQLRKYVEDKILPQEQSFKIAQIPLQGGSEKYLDKNAVIDWSDVMVNYFPADRLMYYRSTNLWTITKEKTLELEKLKKFFPKFTNADITSDKTDRKSVEIITLKQLKQFLEDPVRHGMKRHLGIYDEQKNVDQIILDEDEPFYSEFLVNYNLKMQSLRLWINVCLSSDDVKLQDICDQVYDSFRLKSKTPEGSFASLDKRNLQNKIFKHAENLSPILDKMKSSKKMWRMAIIGEQAHAEYVPFNNQFPVKRFKTLILNAKKTKIQVELHGQLSWIWKDNKNKLHCLILIGSKKFAKEPDKYVFEPVLFYLFCLCADESQKWLGDSGITCHVVYEEGVQAWTYNIDKNTALQYLEEIIADYLNQEKIEWLPFKTVTNNKIKPYEFADDEINKQIKNNFQIQLIDAFEQEASYFIKLAKPAIPSDAFDKIRQRFKIY